MASKRKNSLVANINRRKRAGKSRPKSRSTVSKAAYDQMQKGWPKSGKGKSSRKKKKTSRKKTPSRKSGASNKKLLRIGRLNPNFMGMDGAHRSSTFTMWVVVRAQEPCHAVRTLDQALIEKLREAQERQWREENREAIAAYNQDVEKHGVFSDGSRSF